MSFFLTVGPTGPGVTANLVQTWPLRAVILEHYLDEVLKRLGYTVFFLKRGPKYLVFLITQQAKVIIGLVCAIKRSHSGDDYE